MPFDKERIDRINANLASMSAEDIAEMQALQLKKTAEDFEKFKEALSKDKCYYCGHPLTHFSPKKPCLHWLLKPKGFKKKHFPLLFEQNGFRQINTYLRWVANSLEVGKNINDLVEEQSSNKFIEETITYKNLEWSFSCSESDRNGHAQAHKGSIPHYHFQMKADGNVVINFNAFHIPFTDYDEYSFAVDAGKFPQVRGIRTYDIGMQTILDQMENDEALASSLRYTKNVEDASLHTDIFIQAAPGETISGDDLAKLFEERERTGESMASLAKRLNNVSVQTVIGPGEGVPKIAGRDGGRSNSTKIKKSPKSET